MALLSVLRDPFFIYRYRQLIHVIRSVVALGVLLAVYHVLCIPYGAWAMVSALMVMGSLPHIGGVVEKGLQRLAGTLLGAIYGFFVLILTPHIIIADIVMLIGIGLGLYASFKNRYGYSALMFGITLLMVVGDNDPDIAIGVWRAFNVIVGTVVAIMVTGLLLPQRATDMLRFLMADNIDQLNHLYQANINDSGLASEVKLQLIQRLSAQHSKQKGLVEAVHQERRITRTALKNLLLLEQRMISTVELLVDTHWHARMGYAWIEALPGLHEEQQELAHGLETLAHQLRTGQPITVSVNLFQLERHAQQISKQKPSDKYGFGASSYLMLNQELARQTIVLIEQLQNLQHLPSSKLQRRAHRAHLVIDK